MSTMDGVEDLTTYRGGHIPRGADVADLSAEDVANVPFGDIIATDVQAAINELDTEKASTAHTHDYAATTHTHTEYADAVHTHDYAATDHTHTGYSLTTHTHDYAPTVHTHDYAATSHTHTENLAVASNLSDVIMLRHL